MDTLESLGRRWGSPGIIVGTALLAVIINLVIYGIGTLAGATFDFLRGDDVLHVDALTLAMFTAVPIVVGLTIVAIASRWFEWVYPAALIVGPVAAIGTIFVMVLPEDDLDTGSTIVLMASHVVLGIVIALGVLALRARAPRRQPRFA